MSSRGTKTQQFLEVDFNRRWYSEDGRPPGEPTWNLTINNVEFDIKRFSPRRPLRGSWGWSSGYLYTPWFVASFYVESPFLCETTVSPDFPDEER
ncbi:MAG: hypothetical protein WC054_00280 [Candidatus Nanopelagicales bacterium]